MGRVISDDIVHILLTDTMYSGMSNILLVFAPLHIIISNSADLSAKLGQCDSSVSVKKHRTNERQGPYIFRTRLELWYKSSNERRGSEVRY